MSRMTRREKVLSYLTQFKNEWVDGPALANPVVGGSEGLKRLRELRAQGYNIEKRPHPDRKRTTYQYRLAD